MNFNIEKIENEYYVSDNGDMYGPFAQYKEATDFMNDQIGLLYEHGAMSNVPEGEDNHYRE